MRNNQICISGLPSSAARVTGEERRRGQTHPRGGKAALGLYAIFDSERAEVIINGQVSVRRGRVAMSRCTALVPSSSGRPQLRARGHSTPCCRRARVPSGSERQRQQRGRCEDRALRCPAVCV